MVSLFWWGGVILFFVVDWFNGVEFCFGSDRDCSIICGNLWFYMEEIENDRKFLVRFILSDVIYFIIIFVYFGVFFSIVRSGVVICWLFGCGDVWKWSKIIDFVWFSCKLNCD